MKNDLKTYFVDLPPSDKARFLARLMHRLTIAARASYPPNEGTPDSLVLKLRTFNEIFHRISAHLVSLSDDGKRYPDDVFATILIEKAQAGSCDKELDWAIEDAIKSM